MTTQKTKSVVENKKEIVELALSMPEFAKFKPTLETMLNSFNNELKRKATKKAETNDLLNKALDIVSAVETKASELAKKLNISTQKASSLLRSLEETGQVKSRQEKVKIYFI